jgi:Transferrin
MPTVKSKASMNLSLKRLASLHMKELVNNKYVCVALFNFNQNILGYTTFLKEGFNRSLIQKDHCPYYSSVDEFFGDSCVPGAYEFAENKPSLCALCEKSAGHTEL